MGIKRTILFITLCLLLIIACSNVKTDFKFEVNPTHLPAPNIEVAVQTKVSDQPNKTPTVVTSEQDLEPPSWGLLVSLPVEVSAVLAAGPLLGNQQKNALELRTFRGFGMPTPKPDNPEMLSPQWEFAVPAGTPALAPVTGYVVAIPTLWSDDFSVWLSADGEESGVWEVEHVIDVLVEVGDFVEAGQSIATASVF